MTKKQHPYPSTITGFAWKIGECFATPLSECRFEEGDLLYEGTTDLAVQVKFPPRSASSESRATQQLSAFARNWSEPIIFQFYNGNTPGKVCKLTQGHLYTLLWQGTLADSPQLAIPQTHIDLVFSESELLNFATEFRSAGHSACFSFVTDLYNPTSAAKLRTLQQHLAQTCDFEFLTPDQLRLNVDPPIPTTRLAQCYFRSDDLRHIHDNLLKPILYKPTPGARRSQFRLSAHGSLMSIC